MKVRYKHGGDHGPDDDPIKKILANQMAADRAGMMEGMVQVGDDYVDLPYPTSFTGQATPDRSYILDLIDVGGLAKGAYRVLKNPKATYDALRNILPKKSSVAPEIDDAYSMFTADRVATKEMLEGFAKTYADKFKKRMRDAGLSKSEIERALMNVQQKQLDDRLQNIADRALRQASRDESQNILNLQGRLTDLGLEAKKAEKIAEDIFKKNIDDIFTQTRIDDVVLGKGDQLAKDLGPSLQELYDTDKDMFNAVYNELMRIRKPNMNQFGGKINVRTA